LTEIENWPIDGPIPKGISIGRLMQLCAEANLPESSVLGPNQVGNFAIYDSDLLQIGWIDLGDPEEIHLNAREER